MKNYSVTLFHCKSVYINLSFTKLLVQIPAASSLACHITTFNVSAISHRFHYYCNKKILITRRIIKYVISVINNGYYVCTVCPSLSFILKFSTVLYVLEPYRLLYISGHLNGILFCTDRKSRSLTFLLHFIGGNVWKIFYGAKRKTSHIFTYL